MADNGSSQSDKPISGKMFLYERPELLTREDHARLGISRTARPFDFASAIQAVPITLSEMASAQKHFPIVFSDLENPVPLAVVGLFDDRNLFVNSEGQWDAWSYVPAYLRCHPFAFARRSDEEFAVVIDRAATTISETPEFAFFDGDKLSPQIQSMVDFCGAHDADRRQTEVFCQRLKALGVLSSQRATYTPQGESEEKAMASYVAVDSAKLTDIDAESLLELHRTGALAAMYSHLFSLENWNRLLQRHALIGKNQAKEPRSAS